MGDKYKQDGVDIEAGDDFSRLSGVIARETYGISPFVDVLDLSHSNFRGPRGYRLKNLLKGCIETGVMDGTGTKVVIIDAAGNYRDAASNVIAMTAMDITRWGGLPLIFMNILDVESLGNLGSEKMIACNNIMRGLKEIALKHQYVILTGETAELGKCVGSENSRATVKFNWGGAMLGVYHPDKMILGDTLKPGQLIIALKDEFRSNGISSVRKALAMKYGKKWWDDPEAAADILACASPSQQYDRMLNRIHGWYNWPTFKSAFEMHLIVHLSGGAFESKLGSDMLRPLGLSAKISNLFEPPKIMKKCAEWRGMDAEECYKTWNGGQGALVVVDEKDENAFHAFARSYGIEAKTAGKITRKNRRYTIAIKSKFGDRKIIHY